MCLRTGIGAARKLCTCSLAFFPVLSLLVYHVKITQTLEPEVGVLQASDGSGRITA